MFLSAELSTAENKMYLKFHNFILLLFFTALDTLLDNIQSITRAAEILISKLFRLFSLTQHRQKKTCGCHNKFYFMTIFSILNFLSCDMTVIMSYDNASQPVRRPEEEAAGTWKWFIYERNKMLARYVYFGLYREIH